MVGNSRATLALDQGGWMQRGRKAEGCPGRYLSPCGNRVSLPRCELAGAREGKELLRQRFAMRCAPRTQRTHGCGDGCPSPGLRSSGVAAQCVLAPFRAWKNSRSPLASAQTYARRAAARCKATSLLFSRREAGEQHPGGSPLCTASSDGGSSSTTRS